MTRPLAGPSPMPPTIRQEDQAVGGGDLRQCCDCGGGIQCQPLFGWRPLISPITPVVEEKHLIAMIGQALARGARSARLPAFPLRTSNAAIGMGGARNHPVNVSPSSVLIVTIRAPGRIAESGGTSAPGK